ncbi:MAG: DUF5050 domain-containing protein [Oscillospiraceae bacterium]|nr:DUF5050 domain-containing protein [Oscillospiraceae bacterium]
MKKIWIACLVLVLLTACGAPVETQHDETTTEITTTQITNNAPILPAQNRRGTPHNAYAYGNIVYADGWLFLSEARYGNRLDKMREDGSERTTLVDNTYTTGINVLDGWVYWIAALWGDSLGIHRMRIDGSNQQVLLQHEHVARMLVIDDWIYYQIYRHRSEHQIYRMPIQGGTPIPFELDSDDNHHIVDVVDGWLYFTSFDWTSWPIRRIRADGTGQVETLPGMEQVRYFVVHENWVYFVPRHGLGLYRMRPNSDALTRIHEFTVDEDAPFPLFGNIQVVEDWLFFMCPWQMQLYTLRIDGTQARRVEAAFPFTVVGNWIYHPDDRNIAIARTRLDGSATEVFWDEGIDIEPGY